jgi:DNA replication protein DnaC
MSVESALLEGYLTSLRLTTFIRNYPHFIEDAARTNQSYERFLLALAEQEVAERDHRRQMQRLKAAQFPVMKDLADFAFSAIPGLNQQRILDLARGAYIQKAEPVILVGNPGLGKPQPTNYLSRFDVLS